MDEQTFRHRVINTSKSIHQRPASQVAQHERAGTPEPGREPDQGEPIGPDEIEEDERDRDGNVDPQTNVPPLEAHGDEHGIPCSDDDSLFGDAEISFFELKYPDPRSTQFVMTLVGTDVNGAPIRRSCAGNGKMPLGDLVRMVIRECRPT